MGDSAGSEVTQQLMGAETSGLEIDTKGQDILIKFWWLHAKLWYLQNINNADTTVLHEAIDILNPPPCISFTTRH